MTLTHELEILQAMAQELPDAILSEAIFWPLSGPSHWPRLSVGLMLLTHARLLASETALTPAQHAERTAVWRKCETVLARWPVAAENKAAKELPTRVNLWAAFLQDCRETPAASADNLLTAATHRAIAVVLIRQFPRLTESPAAQRLPALDAALRARWQPGPFLWSAEEQHAFPVEVFWFLYGEIKG